MTIKKGKVGNTFFSFPGITAINSQSFVNPSTA